MTLAEERRMEALERLEVEGASKNWQVRDKRTGALWSFFHLYIAKEKLTRCSIHRDGKCLDCITVDRTADHLWMCQMIDHYDQQHPRETDTDEKRTAAR